MSWAEIPWRRVVGPTALVLGVFVMAVVREPTVEVEIGPPDGRGEAPARFGEMRHAEGRVDIRSGPGLEHPAINFLAPSQEVLVGEPDANGWLAVLDPAGDTIGFVPSASMSDLPPRRSDRFFELEGLVVPVR